MTTPCFVPSNVLHSNRTAAFVRGGWVGEAADKKSLDAIALDGTRIKREPQKVLDFVMCRLYNVTF